MIKTNGTVNSGASAAALAEQIAASNSLAAAHIQRH